MVQNSVKKTKDLVKSKILWGILFISLLGSLMHSLYDFSGNLIIVGIIAPINESIWEHLKLAFLPTILWWILSYNQLAKKQPIHISRWFFSSVVALLICPLFIISFYYTYTGAFGFHSVILDIFSLFIGVAIAQFTALHIYRYANLKKYHYYVAILLFMSLLTAFIVFTFAPPQIPLFID